MGELWHAAGRVAGDSAKRRAALLGVLCSAPALVLGALVSHLLSGAGLAGLARPLAFVLAPLDAAYAGGDDVGLLGYLAMQGLLLAMVWGVFGGALHRLAAVHLTQGRYETPSGAYAFARRHWRGFVGAKAGLVAGTVLPLALVALIATPARLGGGLGGAWLAVSIVAGLLLALLAVIMLAAWATAGFLTTPVIACEDSGSLDGLSRAFGFAGKGLPRLTLWRLAFFGGVVLGATWRAARWSAVLGLGYAALRFGAGEAATDRLARLLGSAGDPVGASRLDLSWGDYLAAAMAALVLFYVCAHWMADVVARVACARTAVYLGLREAVDAVPRGHLASVPDAPAYQDAAEAGFEQVTRLEKP
jgi:hypothetical protein